MSWSQTEIMALAAKAARGAGAPAGQAQQFGKAAVKHLLRGGDDNDLLRALEALPGGTIVEAPRAIDDCLIAGGGDEVFIFSDTADGLFESYVRALPFEITKVVSGEKTQFALNRSKLAVSGKPDRVFANKEFIARLRLFASATLVPDSEASRSAGAGAGLDDND